jgi:hypothetical protein
MSWIDETRKDIASIQSSPKDLKKFGLLIGGGLLLISMLAIWRQWWTPYFILIAAVSGVILILLGVLQPLSLKIIHRYWMGFAVILGNIISRIILLILFYFILTPLAMTARVFDKHFFFKYKEIKHSTYWINRENKNTINYERMS